MSQIPYTRTGSLDTPASLPPVFIDESARRRADQLLLALGLTGRAADNLAEVDRAEDRRRAILDQQAEQLDRGRARRDAATDFQREQPEIGADTLTPASYDDIEGSVAAMLGPRLEGQSQAYRDQYLESAQASYVGAFADQRQRQHDRAVAAAVEHISANVQDAGDQAAIATQEAEFLKLDKRHTKEGFYASVVTPAMRTAAKVGDEEAFNNFRQSLEKAGVSAADIKLAEADLAQAKAREQADAINAFQDSVAKVSLDGGSFDAQRAAADAGRGKVPDEVILRTKEHIDEKERVALGNARSATLKLENQQREDGILGTLLGDSMKADQTGGLIVSVPEDGFRWTDAGGHDQHLTKDEAVDRVTVAAMDQIAAESPDPQTAIRSQAAWLSFNSVTNPLWRRTLEAGFMTNVDAVLRQTEDGTPVGDLPVAMTAGYQLWKSLDIDTQTRERHATSETASFYALAELAEKYVTPGDPKASLLRAVEAARTDPATVQLAMASIADRDVIKASDWADGTINAVDIRADVRRTAAFLYRTGTVTDPKAAIAEASEMVKRQWSKVGGAMVFTADRSIPVNFADHLAPYIIRSYAERHGKDEGVQADDLTIVPGRVKGTWILLDTTTHAQVEGEEGFMTTADLFRHDKERRERIKAGIIETGGNPNALPPPSPEQEAKARADFARQTGRPFTDADAAAINRLTGRPE